MKWMRDRGCITRISAEWPILIFVRLEHVHVPKNGFRWRRVHSIHFNLNLVCIQLTATIGWFLTMSFRSNFIRLHNRFNKTISMVSQNQLTDSLIIYKLTANKLVLVPFS
jgi:hypothetical protein